MSDPSEKDSVFSLLVHKVAPFQFDIGYKVSSASIRDQVVRAQLVVRALNEAELATPATEAPLLICGAGVAGLAAAMEAEVLGIKFVLIEKGGEPGGVLLGKGERYVSPTMYEWPATSVSIHSFPMSSALPILGATSAKNAGLRYKFKSPAMIGDFAKSITKLTHSRLKTWAAATKTAGAKSKFYKNTSIADESKKLLRLTLTAGKDVSCLPDLRLKVGAKIGEPTVFSCILFTAGMAPESPILKWGREGTSHVHELNSETPGFWERDKLLNLRLGCAFPPPRKARVLVVGGGDGAIQDALRCLVKKGRGLKHALDIWNHLEGKIKTDTAKPAGLARASLQDILLHILTLEGYSAIGAMWVANPQIYKDLDQQYKELAVNLLALYPKLTTAIHSLLRTDVECVYLSARSGFSKCYALNRFLIQLFAQALKSKSSPIEFEIIGEVANFSTMTANGGLSGKVKFKDGGATAKARAFDLMVARIGNPGVVYQAIGLTGIKTERVEFGRIPVPLMPPQFPPARSK